MNRENDELTIEELSQVMSVPHKAVNINPENTSYRKEAIDALKQVREQMINNHESQKTSNRGK